MESITIRQPDDFHVHFRRGEILRTVLPFTSEVFGRAMVMPNTTPDPILTAMDAEKYYREIMDVHEAISKKSDFQPLMTIQIVDETTPAIVRDAKKSGIVVAGKVYPKGVTTNSHNGVSDFRNLYPVFEEMQDAGMVLSIHGQMPGEFCLDREPNFLHTLEMIAYDFPDLRIVMEHISTRKAVETVLNSLKNVAATITPHHLLLTLDDVLCFVGEEGREGLNPHHYCQPILQRPSDRQALVAAVLSCNPKFFLGSDTAPHVYPRKVSSCGCAGVFNAPVIMPVLAELITSLDFPGDKTPSATLELFTSVHGAQFYKLPLNDGKITLVKRPWKVPPDFEGIVPLFARKDLLWDVQD